MFIESLLSRRSAASSKRAHAVPSGLLAFEPHHDSARVQNQVAHLLAPSGFGEFGLAVLSHNPLDIDSGKRSL